MRLKSDEVRARILKAAEEEFLLNGYEGTTTRGLSKRAQVSYGNMYKYYQNKGEIFDAVFGDYARQFQNEFHKYLSDFHEKEINSSISELMVEGLISHYERSREKFLVFFTGMEGSNLYVLKESLEVLLKKHMKTVIHNDLLTDIFSDNLLRTVVSSAQEFTELKDFKNALQIFIRYHLAGLKEIQ